MPTYEVYVKYEIEDTMIIEADNVEDARGIAESDSMFTALHAEGYTMPWDNVEAYEASEIED